MTGSNAIIEILPITVVASCLSICTEITPVMKVRFSWAMLFRPILSIAWLLPTLKKYHDFLKMAFCGEKKLETNFYAI